MTFETSIKRPFNGTLNKVNKTLSTEEDFLQHLNRLQICSLSNSIWIPTYFLLIIVMYECEMPKFVCIKTVFAKYNDIIYLVYKGLDTWKSNLKFSNIAEKWFPQDKIAITYIGACFSFTVIMQTSKSRSRDIAVVDRVHNPIQIGADLEKVWIMNH